MSKRIEFPDEPIRVDAGERATPRDLTPEEREEERIWDEEDEGLCSWCLGEGTQDCDGSGADDGEDICVRAHPHWHDCAACHGTGDAKDQWIW